MIPPFAVRIFFLSLCLKGLHRKPGVKLENGESKLEKVSGQTQGGRVWVDTGADNRAETHPGSAQHQVLCLSQAA